MNREMLMLVDAISREKSVERDVVFGFIHCRCFCEFSFGDGLFHKFIFGGCR